MSGARTSRLSGSVPTTYVQLLFDYLARQDVNAEALLGFPRPEPGALGTSRYPLARWSLLLQSAADVLDDRHLGLHVGKTITPAHVGVLGYVLMACGSVGGMLQRYTRYERLFYDADMVHLTVERGSVRMEWRVPAGRSNLLVDECAIAAVVQFVRNACVGQLRLDAVHFAHPAPRSVSAYRTFFGCPVRFDQPSNLLEMPAKALSMRLRSPDPLLLEVMERQADALLRERPTTDTPEELVRRALARLLPEGEPSVTRVAASLHTSTRTLRRRLEARGVTFRELLEDARKRLAVRYLREPQLSLAEIAHLLGYSEQSAFTRAFRQWMGTSPKRWRSQRK